MKLVFAVFWLLVPSMAWGLTVTVKAGEHDTFSRLVLYSGNQLETNVETVGDSITVSYARDLMGLDIRDVFSRLHEGRVHSIDRSGKSVVIKLACQCGVRQEKTEFGQVYFDISEDYPMAAQPNVQLPLFLTILPTAKATPKPNTTPILDLERNILEQALLSASEVKILNQSDSVPEPVSLPVKQNDNPSLEISETAIALPETASRIENASGVQCTNSSELNIENWSDGSSFFDQKMKISNRLMSEFDKIDPEAHQDLAQLYIAFGLGAEAIQVLGHLSEGDTSPLYALATLLSGGQSNFFRDQETCGGPSSLWAVFSAKDRFFRASEDEIFLAYSAVPEAIKEIITEPIVGKLKQNGFQDLANKIVHLSDKTTGQVENESKLVLHNSNQSPEDKIDDLETILNDSAHIDPTVAVSYVHLSAEQEKAISDRFIKILEGLHWDYRHAPQGSMLENSLMIAYVLSGNYVEFLSRVNGVSLDEETYDIVTDLLAKHAPDDVVLRTSMLSQFTQNPVLQSRILDMGLAQNDTNLLPPIEPILTQPLPKFSLDTPLADATKLLAGSAAYRDELGQRLAELGLN